MLSCSSKAVNITININDNMTLVKFISDDLALHHVASDKYFLPSSLPRTAFPVQNLLPHSKTDAGTRSASSSAPTSTTDRYPG